MTIEVALVTVGHSQYDDELWDWLNQHAAWFGGSPEFDLADSFDYWRAWGLLALAGCEIDCSGIGNAAPWDGVYIRFDGSVDELLRRLNALMPRATLD